MELLIKGLMSHKSGSPEESEQRIFAENPGSNSQFDDFFEKLNRHGRDRDRPMMNDLDESFDTLSDGIDGKLKSSATYFEYGTEEVEKEDYSFQYDATFWPGATYDTKGSPHNEQNLSINTIFGMALNSPMQNVRFLAIFTTEAGTIIQRIKTGISAKAQRKVAREIKTARDFGLMPFTTMGTKSFVFGKNMENVYDDFACQSFDRNKRAEPDMEEDEI